MTRRDRGFALLAVLAILAVLTILGATLVTALARGGELERRLMARRELREAARGGLRAAAASLMQDQNDVDWLGEPWAKGRTALLGEDLTVEILIRDEESALPLGGLIRPDGQEDPREVARLERLIRAARLPERVVPCLLDWIDPDRLARPGGLDHPVGSRMGRDGRLRTRGELRLLPPLGPPEGTPGEAYRQMESLVSLRSSGPVNLNTAPEPVLLALSDALTPEGARAVVLSRRNEPFREPADLRRVSGLSPEARADLMLSGTVRSRGFRLRVVVRRDGLEALGTADIIRSQDRLRIVRWAIR